MLRLFRGSAALALALTIIGSPVSAKPWDFIYVDQMDVTLCYQCGLTLTKLGWGLLVNTGTENIEDSELFAATYDVIGSHPEIELTPFINDLGKGFITPVLPHEAVGSIIEGNELLLEELLPGEMHRNTPYQLIAFQIDRMGGKDGPVSFEVTMTMTEERAIFTVNANITNGPHEIHFTHAARTSSHPVPVAVTNTSWGKIKAIYQR